MEGTYKGFTEILPEIVNLLEQGVCMCAYVWVCVSNIYIFLNACCGDRCLLSPAVVLWPGLGSSPASKASAFLTYRGYIEQLQPQLVLHQKNRPCLQLGSVVSVSCGPDVND